MYFARQNIPSAIILTFGNKVALYCIIAHRTENMVVNTPSNRLHTKVFWVLDIKSFDHFSVLLTLLITCSEPENVVENNNNNNKTKTFTQTRMQLWSLKWHGKYQYIGQKTGRYRKSGRRN